MKVKVEYLVTRHMEIEIPDELAKEYKDAHAEDDYNKTDLVIDEIDDYLKGTVQQIDADADFFYWFDWEEID